ncbi:putative membrane-associated kinase regulator 6 [Abeliophyllum distichum]|uniref:Membrane-associated kinase regulator 6 n=1 Tax=Abeliophyllum distichum TaxID=126358 RepID=A0ABD1UQY8_9LAMI
METTQSPSIESFSYSWLANFQPSIFDDSFRASIDGPDQDDQASFIEMDPRLPPSKRFFRVPQDFSFDFPISESPLSLVHADELISNGFLMPLFVKDLNKEMEKYDADEYSSISTTAMPSSSRVSRADAAFFCSALRKCQRLSKRFFRKYLNFFKPICQRMRGRGSRVGSSSNLKMHEMNGWDFSQATSPRSSVAYSADTWRRSCDSESSIYEAVLHCKRTQGRSLSRRFLQ